MKILSAIQTRDADQYTIIHEPIASIDLMERASNRFTDWFTGKFDTTGTVHIFCGTGNNGGDGLVIARLLLSKHYQVSVYLVRYSDKLSPDCQQNLERLKQFPGIFINEITDEATYPIVNQGNIIVDAIFGSGLSRPVTGFTAQLIEHLNKQDAVRVAIDIPSGLFADEPSSGTIFRALYTCTFQAPKLSFLLPENGPFVGEWTAVDIGLSQAFIQQTDTQYHLLTEKDIILKRRQKFSHKGSYGHALLIGGSYGKMGAVVLAAKACLHSGAGLVSTYIPACGYEIMQTAFPEAMVNVNTSDKYITILPADLSSYSAIGFGPGVGQYTETGQSLHELLDKAKCPFVIDADGLNLLSQYPEWFNKLPKETILTPHPKEFERLFGKTTNSFERLALLQTKAQELGIIIVLKGAHTAIALPDGTIWFNNTGNPGMATAGSGDVLTGMITSLLAQGYSPADAARYGVYVHGLAGAVAVSYTGQAGLVAGDMIENIGWTIDSLNTV